MKRFCLLCAIILALFGCENNGEVLKKSINKEFSVFSEVVIDGSEVVVVLPQIPQKRLKSPYLIDYLYSAIVQNVLLTLGEEEFAAYTTIRVDVVPLKVSYTFPTKEYLFGRDKIALIPLTIAKLEGDELESKAVFDESITVELFEEQILKEWNGLEQWNGVKINPELVGVKVLQLSSEVGYFLKLGAVQTNKSGEQALIEFLFESDSEKVLGLNVTYL